MTAAKSLRQSVASVFIEALQCNSRLTAISDYGREVCSSMSHVVV